jgi:hypothetical protein
MNSLLLGLLLASSPFAQDPVPASFGVPVYVPRQAFVGAFFRDAVTPQLRVGWEATVVQERRDALILLLELGGGYGFGLPKKTGPTQDVAMTFLYQHTAQAGLGLRATFANGFHWGAQVTAGPLFYGARFKERLRTEERIGGMMEGRLQFGLRRGTFIYGISGGYGRHFGVSWRSTAGEYLGGAIFGAFVDWR